MLLHQRLTAVKFCFVVCIAFTVAFALSACTEKPANSADQAALQAKEKKASVAELKQCLRKNYMQTENMLQSRQQLAETIHQLCGTQFVHLRAVKLNFAPVPDIMNPPQKVLDEEMELTLDFVKQSRVVMYKWFKKRQNPHGSMPHFKPNPNPKLPKGHPPIKQNRPSKPGV